MRIRTQANADSNWG